MSALYRSLYGEILVKFTLLAVPLFHGAPQVQMIRGEDDDYNGKTSFQHIFPMLVPSLAIIYVLHGFLEIFIGDCGEPRPQTTLEIIMLHGVCFNGQFHWFSDIL